MGKAARLAEQLGILVAALLLWQFAVTAGLVDSRTLPPPSAVAVRVVELLGESSILLSLWETVSAVLLAGAIVVPIGILIGLLLGESHYWGKVFKPFFYFMSSVPKSIFLPLFILALGIGYAEKVAFGVFQAIFVLVISAIAATQSVPADYIRMARSYGASKRQIYLEIYLPAMLPIILEGLRLGMIFNITGVIFAEMYASRRGLGNLVATWGMQFDMKSLFAGIVLAAALAIIINETLRHFENKLGQWRV